MPMRFFTTLFISPALFLTLAACGASDGPSPPSSGPGGASSVDDPASPNAGPEASGGPNGGPGGTKPAQPFVPARKFANSPASWTVGLSLTANQRGSTWQVADMNGDGKPDLVVTQDPTTQTVWGGDASPHWRVYENQGASFDATPTTWPVPSSRFSVWSGNGYGVLDVDGDDRPDLADFGPEGAFAIWGAGAGTPHLQMHVNQGAGFAPNATSWALPANVPSTLGFVSLLPGSRQTYVSLGAWSLVDYDGDGRLDLVDPTSKPWKIYRGKAGGGLATTPSTLATPTISNDSKGEYGFGMLNGNLWATLDLDGDHVLDLVATGRTIGSARLAFETSAKTPYWKMFRGDGANGFASSPAQWVVPGAPEYPEDFDRFGPMSDTFDLDGDGKLDLVTMGRSYVYGVLENKTPHWRVYFGGASGFGLTKAGAAPTNPDPGPSVATDLAYEWPLPMATVGASPLISRDGSGWMVEDLDGDGRKDLIVVKPAGFDVYLGAP